MLLILTVDVVSNVGLIQKWHQQKEEVRQNERSRNKALSDYVMSDDVSLEGERSFWACNLN